MSRARSLAWSDSRTHQVRQPKLRVLPIHTVPVDTPRCEGEGNGSGSCSPYSLSTYWNTSGATIDASLSMMNLGVSTASLPQVIFSLGTAPE